MSEALVGSRDLRHLPWRLLRAASRRGLLLQHRVRGERAETLVKDYGNRTTSALPTSFTCSLAIPERL